MSEDEVIMLLAASGFMLFLGSVWYFQLHMTRLAPYPGNWRSWLGLAPVAALGGICAVLLTLAASDVRTAPQYILLYLLMGAVWVFCAVRAFSLTGISYRDDALERRNPAAAILVICVLGANAAIWSGANIGDGPGWWVVVFAALLGGCAWFALWTLVEAFTGVSESVTVGRDVPAAIRFGGYMLASGPVIGRGVAGDWVSMGATLTDFVHAWPAAALAAGAVAVEKAAPRRMGIAMSLGVAAIWLATAGYAVYSAPPMSQNPVYDQPRVTEPEVEVR